MHVVPDVLPALHPSIDLRVAFPEAPPHNLIARTRRPRKYKSVEPGVFLLPEQVSFDRYFARFARANLAYIQTRRPPRMTVTVFHPETRYYTLLLVDPDVPDPEQRGFTTYLHWMQYVLYRMHLQSIHTESCLFTDRTSRYAQGRQCCNRIRIRDISRLTRSGERRTTDTHCCCYRTLTGTRRSGCRMS